MPPSFFGIKKEEGMNKSNDLFARVIAQAVNDTFFGEITKKTVIGKMG